MSIEKNAIEEQSINDINYELLKKQFPNAVSKDEDGKYVIDPAKLQMALDPSKAEIEEDGYGLNWVGKKEAYHKAFTKNYKVLKPLKDDSKNWDETQNLLIKGDNLDALKILRQNYFESIKMIYIDPPYNTKNDGFVYNDNFTTSAEQTLEELGYDEEYIDYIENIQGAKTHSGWLNFIYPRLLLAKDLLKDDGVIFISIDDNEVAQLRLLCDEVFGEENFVGNIAWESKTKTQNTKTSFNKLQPKVEHILLYTKQNKRRFNLIKIGEKEYPLKDEKGKYREYTLEVMNADGIRGRESMVFPILNVNPPMGKQWKLGQDTINNFLLRDDVFLKDNYVIIKMRPDDENNEILQPFWGFLPKKIGTAESAKKELSNVLEGKHGFETVKPVELIKRLIFHTCEINDLILDFFAGSGTTAHAVMDLNKEDNGNRKYICVQWAEETPEKSEAKKAGYETIFDITKARIDKAGDQIAQGDIGFRTFEIVEDQKQKIYQKSLEEMNQDDMLSFMEKPDIESNEEILYNLFVAEALPLSTKHQELIKDKLYLASNVAFILGDITSDELVDSLKDKKECEYITVYSPNISDDKFTLEIESNISKLGIKPDKLRFRG